jgi:hypothetical protein
MEQVGSGYLSRQRMMFRSNTDFFTRLDLVSNVHGRSGIVPYAHRRETRSHIVRFHHVFNFKLYILLDLVR